MSWFSILPVIQGIAGVIATAAGPSVDGTAGLISAEVQRWLLLVAGLPLTVQVPLAAHMINQNAKKTNAAIRTLAALPLSQLHVRDDLRSQIRSFAATLPPEPKAKKGTQE